MMTFRDCSEPVSWVDAAEAQPLQRRRGFYLNGVKRSVDLLLILVTVPIWLPIIVGMAAMVMLEGHSPFYRQKRLGRGGRVFNMLKIRTMVPGADMLLDKYLADNPDARREWDANQKLRHDPRITRFGYFLRKSSLDELPQLWNVLKGEMSLVGPRPMMVDQRSLYPGTAYFDLRPGITGSWQVSERNKSTFADRADFDAEYLSSVSLTQDLAILVKTVGVVLRGTGC